MNLNNYIHAQSSLPLISHVAVVKVKAAKLQTKGRQELLGQLDELKKELSQLRVAQVNAGQPAKLAKM